MHRKTHLMSFVGLSALVFIVSSAESQPPESDTSKTTSTVWETKPAFAVPAKDLLAIANDIETGDEDDVHVFLRDRSYQIDAEGRVKSRFHEIYRVLTRQGVQNRSTIDVRWQPWFEERPTIRCRVITKDGDTFELDPQTIAEAPVESGSDVFTDDRELRAPLPGLSRGAIVEYVIESSEHQPFFSSGTSRVYGLASSYPVDKFRVTIEAPASIELKHGALGAKITPTVSNDEATQRVVYEKSDTAQFKHFDYFAPPEYILYPQVRFTTVKSWATVANAYHETVEKQIAKADAVKAFAQSSIPKGKELSRIEKVNRLLTRLHDFVRYTGVEFGEAAIVPRSPDETLARRYGDCKDKSTLLVALLREVGIEAHVALLYAGTGTDISREYPSMSVFNHAIVYVPGDQPIWIDPTVEFAAAGQLPAVDQFRFALVASAETKDLIRTPQTSAEDNRMVKRREFRLSSHKLATLDESSTSYGGPGRRVRSSYVDAKKKDVRERWERYAQDQYSSDKVSNISFSDPLDTEAPFKSSATISEVNRAEFDDSEVALYIYPEWVVDRLPYELTAAPKEYKDLEEDERRKAPLWMAERFVAELQYRIVPPPGFVAKKLPENERYDLAPGMVLTQTVETTESGTVHVDFKLNTGEGRLSADEVAAVREKLFALHKSDELADWYLSITFQEIGAQLLENGKVAEAISEYRRLIEKDPNDAMQYARLAEALLEAGLGDLAAENAKKAAELDPENVAVHRILGTVLMHDSYGRYLSHGFDVAGAEAALRRCVELSEDDIQARWTLAILLEHTAEGFRYGEPERLREAIEIYKEVIEDSDHDGIKSNLMFAMLHNRDFKELSTLINKWDSNETRQAIRATLLAITDGAPAASEFIGRAADSREVRTTCYETAASQLNRLKYYKEAIELMELAPGQSATARQTVDVLRQLRPFKDVRVSPSEPEYAVQQFFIQAISHGPYSEQALSEFDQFELPKDRTVLFQLPRGVSSMMELAVEADTPLSRALDVVSLIQFETESDGDSGYRITAEYPAGGQKSTWYVVRNGDTGNGDTGDGVTNEGEYQLFNQGLRDYRIGEKVLTLIKDGKQDVARKWLKWCFQTQKKNLRWFDEWSATPFARVWFLGKHDEEQTLRTCAAMLMAPSDNADAAIDILLTTRKQLEENDARRFQVDRALVDLYRYSRKFADAESKIKEMLAKHSKNEVLLNKLIPVLIHSGKGKEAIELAKDATASRKVPDTVRFLCGWALVEDGQFDAASLEFEKLSERSTFKAGAANAIAWNAMFVELSESDQVIADKAFQELRRTADANRNGDVSAILHTLAYLHANRGEVVQARDVLYRSIALRGFGPTSHDFLVLGKIAEHCGYPNKAVEFYKHVLADDQDEAGRYSSSILAKRRLEALGNPVDSE